MVYKLLQDYFILDDFMSGFNIFFKVCEHIIRNHVPPSVSRLLSPFQLLTLEKQFESIHPIRIGEVAHTLIIQFKGTLMEIFCLHQFGVMICGGYETMVHGV
jgi:hypothetical protein